jgi:hypothetical protein
VAPDPLVTLNCKLPLLVSKALFQLMAVSDETLLVMSVQ